MDAHPSIETIADALLVSYGDEGGKERSQGLNLPSMASIIDLTHRLQDLLFPGFLDDDVLDEARFGAHIRSKILETYERLRTQVLCDIVFEQQRSAVPGDPGTCLRKADEITLHLLRALPEIRAVLALDVEALFEGDPAARSREEVILSYPGFHAITVHRLAHWLWSRDVRLVARMLSEHVHAGTGIDIHPGASIGTHFYIDHGTGVVIGETTVIGNHVKMYQGVSLGARSVSKALNGRKRHPTIEDSVTIYAGATILGGETVVGHHSVIGGNVWLVHSVPPASVVENAPQIHINRKQRMKGRRTCDTTTSIKA
jgi:serine O-acetyltransferase